MLRTTAATSSSSCQKVVTSSSISALHPSLRRSHAGLHPDLSKSPVVISRSTRHLHTLNAGHLRASPSSSPVPTLSTTSSSRKSATFSSHQPISTISSSLLPSWSPNRPMSRHSSSSSKDSPPQEPPLPNSTTSTNSQKTSTNLVTITKETLPVIKTSEDHPFDKEEIGTSNPINLNKNPTPISVLTGGGSGTDSGSNKTTTTRLESEFEREKIGDNTASTTSNEAANNPNTDPPPLPSSESPSPSESDTTKTSSAQSSMWDRWREDLEAFEDPTPINESQTSANYNSWIGISDRDVLEGKAALRQSAGDWGDTAGAMAVEGYSFLTSPLANAKSMTIRGMVFDSKGQVSVLDKSFKRGAFCAENTLQPRDLRKIDSSLADQLPTILVRDKAILVNLMYVKALIKSDSVILFSSVGGPVDEEIWDAGRQSAFIHELQGRLASKDSPHFELRAIEAILISVMTGLREELEELLQEVNQLLDALNARIMTEDLKLLLLVRRRMSKFVKTVDALRGAINELLHNDEDLAGMYLSDKAAGKPRHVSDHMEIELMLEHYAKLADEISSTATETASHLQTTQGMIGVVLDSQRNELILTDLRANLATLAVSCGALVAGFFGMNLPSYVDAVPGAFYLVGVGTVGCVSLLYISTIIRLRSALMKSGKGGLLRIGGGGGSITGPLRSSRKHHEDHVGKTKEMYPSRNPRIRKPSFVKKGESASGIKRTRFSEMGKRNIARTVQLRTVLSVSGL
ncbi:magnesium ion transporter [Blyttiomyces sp. JEL0837]|nr:magnesium ion transporter [Blyttiomyces sp. JEL0837]